MRINVEEPMIRPRAIRPSPRRLHEVVRIEAESDPVKTVIADIQPKLMLRPVARKAIPATDTEEFYRRTHEEGCAGTEVHQAVMESQDWHRKWTHQDENGHTMPERHLEPSRAVPDYYAFCEDRMAGAKNPSPVDRDSFMMRPRSNDDLEREDRNKRTRAVSPEVLPRVHSTIVVRPIARRASQPMVPMFHNIPPQDILAARSDNLSPLTLDSGMSGGNSFSHQTQLQPCEVSTAPMHIIEPEQQTAIPPHVSPTDVQQARDGILRQLAISGGETTSREFADCLETLQSHFDKDICVDTCLDNCEMSEGTWLTLTKAMFFGNLGENDDGDPMYTLGRMSFDMFSPTQLVCSLQGNFNSVERVDDADRMDLLERSAIPKSMREEVQAGNSLLRTYNIVTAFTIELPLCDFPNAPNKDTRRPIRGIMTTFGYTLPDPEQPNRHSVWITGGKIEPNDDPQDQAEWNRLFGMHPPSHSFGEKAKLLAVQLLMGATIPSEMQPDGSLEYTFTRPLGGHGFAYVDTLYVDETMRIVRGHRGTTFVFSRHSSM